MLPIAYVKFCWKYLEWFLFTWLDPNTTFSETKSYTEILKKKKKRKKKDESPEGLATWYRETVLSCQGGFGLLRESAAHHGWSSLLLVLYTLPSCRWSKPELKRDSCAPMRTGTIPEPANYMTRQQISGHLRTIRGPYIGYFLTCPVQTKSFTVAQTVKNLPAMQETWVQPLGW